MQGSMTGWYHLLPESVGKLKHIRVTQKQLVDDDDKENSQYIIPNTTVT